MEILALIWGILNIILFFKIWGACNNIKRIADKYAPNADTIRRQSRRRHLHPNDANDDLEDPYATVETKEEIDAWLNAADNSDVDKNR